MVQRLQIQGCAGLCLPSGPPMWSWQACWLICYWYEGLCGWTGCFCKASCKSHRYDMPSLICRKHFLGPFLKMRRKGTGKPLSVVFAPFQGASSPFTANLKSPELQLWTSPARTQYAEITSETQVTRKILEAKWRWFILIMCNLYLNGPDYINR